MIDQIIRFSLKNKLLVFLFSMAIVAFGLYSLSHISIGAVPDITNNQVQIITTSRNLATEDVERFITYPIELEMANLPNVKEIRSVSKFGLSVVTVVFDDEIGTYLPRQLIAEKIKSASENIPEQFGKPFMGPISTGLGEIYQYVLEVDSAHQGDYDLMELRTIQDWIVRRQLSGIPGVVEVNTWGGYLKQYEVAVDPVRLRNLNLSLAEVYQALQKNNDVAGGGYIEKAEQSYFVRGEGLVENLEDIEQIVIKNRNGNPIFMRDVGKVGFGHAIRFGAITGNGEGEKVMGQVMMLKGANSKETIDAVKERVDQIQESLPPGVSINGFLERSELIGRTSFTIAENLILGCLIVIFVVVILLGNLRSGLVVASVIPLSLLFALSMMYLFGIDANLMSLGAIDFGIIIDGAVIIVEFISFNINSKREELVALPLSERQAYKDGIAEKSAEKMMHSAVFGQLIIIIVFIPILSLVGVEGKMFRPMAMVFCFALVGAMMLCFTYVPVMSSLFIKPSSPNPNSFYNRLISWLQSTYRPIIHWALVRKKMVLSGAIALLIIAGFIFSRMGGEFVPTLDEGDFVIQPVLKTGTSLEATVQIMTKIEEILMGFPEVEQVVSRIGAAEVPTDPMSMEETDCIIKLSPISEWKNASSKDELAEVFKDTLSVLPGIEYEFTQPIEMRFNELITGVRADLAIKIFGEDLEILYDKALEVRSIIGGIEGAADITVEKIEGLPQMTVDYDRSRIAAYGLNVSDLNQIISMGFAGLSAGTVLEGEKLFDLVVRFDKEHHQSIEDLRNASIPLPNGRQIPLSELADISYQKGPAKISRDDTKRRIVVGVNVRNRDLESVVDEAKQKIAKNVKLPVGYSLEYGGQFENLEAASKRLSLAVPVALLLIFIFLYFAFNSTRDALIIFSAIPLSAVGGIIMLSLRGMPFSISAGVGFIALFGIAVLNGIVLIEEFKELKNKGIADINERIMQGTHNRLRPVLLTASAAALGFLPMAISTSAGAEVQRPLATVVIGGLISATALTLIVLPVLYSIFGDKKIKLKVGKGLSLKSILLLLIALPTFLSAQQKINLEKAIEIALENNRGIVASEAAYEYSQEMIGNGFDLEKTEIYYMFDEANIAPNNEALDVIGINQSFRFPTIYSSRRKMLKAKSTLSLEDYRLEKRKLSLEVSKAYYEIVYEQDKLKHYVYLDSLYSEFESASEKKYKKGESNYLESLMARSKRKEVEIEMNQIRESLNKAYIQFNSKLQADTIYLVEEDSLKELVYIGLDTIDHPQLQYYDQAAQVAEREFKLAKQHLWPDLNVSVFRGSNNAGGQEVFSGFQLGVAIPLWFGPQKSKIDAARSSNSMMRAKAEDIRIRLLAQSMSLQSDLKKYREELDYYRKNGKQLAIELETQAIKAYRSGEISYLEYIQSLESSRTITLNYLLSLFQYNITVLEANYLIN
ncbi:MAG: CusA/CzcA family heavy metal efflux RND transporter [Flavobacteriales bacterium]|nr:CusA/CzcA family heavy metal efflux RND transporter [Flavobacteriales bacterium]